MSTVNPSITALSEAKRRLLEKRLRGQITDSAPATISRRSNIGDPPLSPAQHGVWLADQLRSDTSISGVYRVMWVRGRLDVEAFRSAVTELVDRHEILRTNCRVTDSGPVQVVGTRALLPVELTRASGDTPEERRTAALRLVEQSYTRPFDLERGPLFSVHVCEVDPDEHLVLFRMHHLLTDEWSCGLLAKEMATLYAAHRRGGRSELPALPIQYGDYAAWTAAPEQVATRGEQVAHWKQTLDGIPPVLELPTDRIRPGHPSHRAGVVRRELSPRLSDGLSRLAAERNTTMFSTLLTLFSVVLYRYSGQDRFAIGSLLSGRGRSEVESLMGMFASTVAIPVDFTTSSGFGELLDRTGATVVRALDNQDATFDQVVSALKLPRDPSRNPLFQVLFQCMEASEHGWTLDGLECEPVWQDTGLAKVDLTLIALNQSEGITVELTYATDLFQSSTAERILDHLAQVAEAVVADPSVRLADIDMLTTAERQDAVVAWNATEYVYPATATVHSLFERQAAEHPERVAVRQTDGSTVSYADLNARANRTAHYLRTKGVSRETLVGVCMDHSVDMFVTLLGVLKAGAAYVPLDVSLPRQRMEWILSDTASPLVLTTRNLAGSIPNSFDGEVIAVDAKQDELAEYPAHNQHSLSEADNLVYIIYTSGSTGRPKGVQVPHRGVVNYLWWAIEGYGLEGERGAPMLGSIAFDLSVPNFWLPLIGGKCVTLLPTDDTTGLDRLSDTLRQPHDFSLLKITPGHLDVLRGMLKPDSVHSVRTFVVGADEVRPETVSGWQAIAPGARIINEYGPTETVVGCSVYTIPDDFDSSVSVSIGKPIGNLRMYVLDNGLKPAPVGVTGELYIGGDGVVRGYLNRPALTAEKFVPDPFSLPGSRLYRTGDLARYRANGDIEFLGRRDFQVKVRGYRIELGEVEARLGLHPEVTEAVAAAVTDKNGHKRLVGYIVADAVPPTPAELREFVAATLPEYMVPTVFVVLDSMPLTSAGKVDRTALPAPGSAGSSSFGSVGSGDGGVLAGIWSDLLQVPDIGAHDNFFELGGDSILAIKLVTRLREAGYSVRPSDIFRYQTLAELSAGIGRGDTPKVVAAQGPIIGETPLSPIQHWFTRLDVPHDHYNQAARIQLPNSTAPRRIEAALSRVVQHHDALRLRLKNQDGNWRQVTTEPDTANLLWTVDLTGLDEKATHVAMAEAATRAHESLSLTAGPLLRAVRFQRDDRDNGELLIAIHHLAVDTVSWGVLLEDLSTLLAGRNLPPKTTSFHDWSQRLNEYANSPEFDAEYEYWRAQSSVLADLPPLPTDQPVTDNRLGQASNLVSRLPSEETAVLTRSLPAAAHVRVDEVLLTAFARAVLAEWGGSEVAVDVEGHGREDLFSDVDLTRTVGWFTTTHPVVLRPPGAAAGEWIGSVRDQLRAIPQRGIGYGLARYLRDGKTWPETEQPRICFNYLGSIDGTDFESLGGERADSGRRPYLLDITAYQRGGELWVVWNHGDCHDSSTIARLAKNFEEELRGLLTLVGHDEHAGSSEFPLAELPIDSLSTLVSNGSGGITDVYRLSPLQTGMLYQTVAEPDRGDYIEQFVYTLDGDLDPAALHAAWHRVIERHPALRTSFVWRDLPHPVQLVHRETDVAWSELDWRGMPEDQVQGLLNAERTRHLSLVNGPPLRFQLIRLADDKHYLVWTFHHILLDGWSVPIVLDEVFTTYRGIRDTGEPPALPEPVPYRDHIAWLAEHREVPSREFWSRALSGVPMPTPIPAIGVDSGHPEVRIAQAKWTPDQVNRLRGFAREQRVTVGTVLQSAWALRLSQDSGEPDVVYGTTSAGRSANLPGIDRMVGLLMTTLPARISVTDAPVGDWLRTVHMTLGDLRDHEHTPLRDIRRASGVASDHAMFNSIFVFENFDEPSDDATGSLRLELTQAYEQPGYPLVMEVGLHDELLVKLCYDHGRIDDSAAAALLESYMDLLSRLIGLASRVSDLVKVAAATRPAAIPQAISECADFRAPRNDTERTLSRLWSDVLDVPVVGVQDDFFDLGGDSILAMRIVAEARQAGLMLSTEQLFTHRTIAKLAMAAAVAHTSTLEESETFPSTGLESGELEELRTAAGAQDVYPLSSMQEGMLFHTLYEPDREDYHLQFVMRLEGDLDTIALTAAWRHVIQRHAVLRSTFVWEGVRRPMQLVHGETDISIIHSDWSDLDESHVDDRMSSWLEAEHHKGFDIQSAPPLKLDLIRIGPNTHRFVWQFHHLLLDGWSTSAVIAEVFEAYEALRAADVPPSHGPAPRFGDYVEWQRRQNVDDDRAYWRNYLAGFDSPTPLPLDRPKATPQDGDVCVEVLPEKVLRQLQDLCRKEKVTLAASLHAAWALLLSRHSGNTDVLFGSSLLGRSAAFPGVEDVIGVLMTTLPVRVSVSPDQSLTDYLRSVHSNYLAVRGHEHSALMDVQRCSELPDGPRLFDSIFVFKKPAVLPQAADLTIDADYGFVQNGFPLLCAATLTDELKVALEYQRNVVTDETANSILADFLDILRGIAEGSPTIGDLTRQRGDDNRDPLEQNGTPKISARVPRQDHDRPPPQTTTEQIIAEVWKQVLGLPNVGRDDDYFGLGGNSINAIRVVSLAKQAGLRLSLNDIFERRTLKGVAAAATDGTPQRRNEVVAPRTVTGPVELTPIQRWFAQLNVPHDRFNQARLLRSAQPIDANLFEDAVHALVRHHDGLRSRLRRDSGGWRQAVAAVEHATLSNEIDLREVSAADSESMMDEAADKLHTRLDLRNGPLVRATLFRTREADFVLVVVHQLVVDAVSWEILIKDLNEAYEQRTANEAIVLPDKSTSYQQWSRLLTEYSWTEEFAAEAGYWQNLTLPVAPLPVDHETGPNTAGSTRVLTAKAPRAIMDPLVRRSSAIYGATIDDVLVTAMTRTLQGWSERPRVRFDVRGPGRETLFDDVDVSRTIGWFTTTRPFGIHLETSDVGASITAVRDRLHAAPHNGIGYGLARYLGPTADGEAGDDGQLVLAYHGKRSGNEKPRVFTPCAGYTGTARDPIGERPHLFQVDTEIVDGELRVAWEYTTRRHTESTVSTLIDEFIKQLSTMLEYLAAIPDAHHRPLIIDYIFPGSPLLLVPMGRHRIPGISVATMRGGVAESAWCHGTLKSSGDDTIQPGTVFQAGSISKLATAIGVLRLSEQGLFSLDEDVNAHLLDWHVDQPVSVRQLLAHTAGLSIGKLEGHHPEGRMPTLLDVLNGRSPATCAPTRVETLPGARQRYSNSHYNVIQHLMSSVTGEPFPDLMRSLVLSPLDMNDSGFQPRVPGTAGHEALAHDLQGNTFPEGWLNIPESGAAGLWSSPRDLIRMMVGVRAAFIGHDISFLSQASARVLLNPGGDGMDETADRWLRFDVGGTFGYQCLVASEQVSGGAVVIMTNGEGGRGFIDEVTDAFLKNMDSRACDQRSE